MDKHCNGCGQENHCREIYEKLGRREGPNVAFKAVVAFVVPIAVFVAAALLAQTLLKNKIENVTLMVLIQLVTGLGATGIVVFIIRQFHRRNSRKHKECPEKEKYPLG
jgi:positive regulator of sigma E activity